MTRLAAALAVVVLGTAAFGSCQPTVPTLSAQTLVSNAISGHGMSSGA